MSSARAWVLGALAVAVGLAVDVGGTHYLADAFVGGLTRAALMATGAPANEVDARTLEFLSGYGLFVGFAVGAFFTVFGGFVTAGLAPRARMLHAIAMGALSMASALPDAARLFVADGGLSPRVWLFLTALTLSVPAAALGAALRALAFGRRGRAPAAPPAPEPTAAAMTTAFVDAPAGGLPGDALPGGDLTDGLPEAGDLTDGLPEADRFGDALPPDPLLAEAAPAAELSPAPSSPVVGSHRASFHGTGADLFGIHIVNVFLILVTAGFYRFWGRARVRRFLYGHTEFEGDRLAFHGTGRELFRGWCKGMAFIGLPLFGLQMLEEFAETIPTLLLMKVVGSAIAAVVLPIAIAGAWRYRLSRTEWRGIRFSFRGRPQQALKVFLAGLLMTALSLGLCFPVLQVNMHRFLMKDAYFGSRRFAFDGRGADLVGRFALLLVVAVPTYFLATALFPFTYGLSYLLGGLLLVRLWFGYTAARQRYLMAHTTFEGARFRSTVTGSGLFWLNLINGILILFTLGLGVPWAQVRSMRYAVENLVLEGSLDLAGIQQEAQSASPTGEGIADVMDADALDFGVGV